MEKYYIVTNKYSKHCGKIGKAIKKPYTSYIYITIDDKVFSMYVRDLKEFKYKKPKTLIPKEDRICTNSETK